jgi:hypothetical protein
MTMADRPAMEPARSGMVATDRLRTAGSVFRTVSGPRSMTIGAFGVPMIRASLSTVMACSAGMMRPQVEGTRYSGLSPRGEIAVPMSAKGIPQLDLSSLSYDRIT